MKLSPKSLAAAWVGVAAILIARPHRILRGIAAGLRQTVETPDTPDPVAPVESNDDEAHAPGHHHLSPPPDQRAPRPRQSWPRRADRNGNPGRFR